MSNFTGLDQLVKNLTGGGASNPQTIWFNRVGRIGTGSAILPRAAQWTSLWNYGGQPYANDGSEPFTPATTCSVTTTGSIPYNNAVSASGQNWLLSVSLTANAAGGGVTYLLYDRLAHMSGIDSTVTSQQVVSCSLGGRYTGSAAVGNLIALEVYVSPPATAQFVTVQYKNQNGVIQTSISQSVQFSGVSSIDKSKWIWIPLAEDDIGVQEVMGVNVSPATASTGSYGITIFHPLVYIPIGRESSAVRDMVMELPSPQLIQPNACLAWVCMASAAAAASLNTTGCLTIVEA